MGLHEMIKLRLAQILERHKEQCGSIAKLAEAINKANNGEKSVAPRKLAPIIGGNPNSLTLSELEAIDNYLKPFGQSLADLPLFDADTVERALVEQGEVVLYLSTRVVLEREYTSVWDTRAFSGIAESIHSRWPTTRVILKEQESQRLVEQATPDRDWSQLVDNTHASYCCLGSPLTSGLAEYMLAAMFGVPAFKPPPVIRNTELPFYFVWYPHPDDESRSERISSHFAHHADDLAKAELTLPQDLPEAIRDRKAQAFLVGKNVHEVRLDQEEWKDYGVIVAQRREQGKVWVVVAGLSGPGTFAAARLLGETPLALPESRLGEISRPVYAVVESAVRINPKKTSGDRREVMGQKILGSPQVWNG